MKLNNMEALLKRAALLRKGYSKMCIQVLESYKFSPCEIDILIFLSHNKNINTSKEIVVYLGVAKSLIARSLESLIQRGLVRTEIDKEDKRIIRLFLTKESEPLIKKMKESQVQFMNAMCEGIEEKDIEIMEKTFEKLHNNLFKLIEGNEDE